MKKFIFIMVTMFATICANAQNYSGNSKFSDNWSITLQGGVVTPMNDFFKNGSTTPTVVLGIDKYVTPWLGFGVEGRTTIGVGDNYNPHTVFDAVNVSGNIKFNINNLFDFNGCRKTFEPVVYTGLGWGHYTCSDFTPLSTLYETNAGPSENYAIRNFLTYRAGLELNFNLGESKAWGIVVNPSVVWGNIDNGRLTYNHGNFEVTAGVVYHFKTSNGTHGFVFPVLYNQSEVDALNAKINKLQEDNTNLKKDTKSMFVYKKPQETVQYVDNKYSVTFAQNSSELTDAAKAILDKVPSGSNVSVTGSTSPEGTVVRNTTLAQERADVVANYLKNRGVNVTSAVGGEAGRAAVITLEK